MDISGLKEKIEGEISRIGNIEDLKRAKVSLLGRKGVVADYLDKLKTLDKDQRRDAGKAINEIKTWADLRIGELEKHFDEIERQKKERASLIDITMPGTAPLFGRKHPITLTLEEIIRIFGSLVSPWRKAPISRRNTTISRPSISPRTIRPVTCRTHSTYGPVSF